MSSSQQPSSGLSQDAKDAQKKAQQGASDFAHQAEDAGQQAKDKASSGLNKAEHEADKAGSQAERKADGVSRDAKKKSGRGKTSKEDKDKLKVAGAVVAVGAALVLGGVKVYKSRQDKEEPTKGKLEEKTSSGFNWFGRKADKVDKKLDGKGGETKNKASEVADSVANTVKGAAENTKGALSDVGHTVSGSTKGARDKVSDVGLKIEEKGLRASADSDRAVRDAWGNAADRANQVGGSSKDKAKRGKEKSGNIFEAIGDWLNDRKDDASNAAGSAKRQVQDTGKKAKK